jgi:hypothetical protein
MARDHTAPKEAWFERRRFGGMRPIHWKGYALILGMGPVGAAFVLSAVSLPERFNYAGILRPACVVIAGVWFVTLAVLSYRHSRPWRDRY